MQNGVGGRENGELLFNKYRVLVSNDEKVMEMDGGDGYSTMSAYLILVSCMLKNGYNE